MFKISLMYLKGFNFIQTVYELFDNPSCMRKMVLRWLIEFLL